MSKVYCAFCGDESQQNYSVHRDGFDVGPEIWLCNNCGKDPAINLDEIWAKIANPEPLIFAMQQIEKPCLVDPVAHALLLPLRC